MSFDLSMIKAVPDFRDWMLSGKWKRRFATSTLQRSSAYASSRFIKNPVLTQGSAEQGLNLRAAVHGTAPLPYQTDIQFRWVGGQLTVDPDCSCPVGAYCKHAAALLSWVTAELKRESILSQPQPTQPVQPQSRPQHHFDPQLREWLMEIESAAKSGPPDPQTIAVAKPENRFLAYCIESPLYRNDSSLNFVLRVGTRRKDGKVSISDTRSLADLSNPPKYMEHHDLVVAALYHKRHRSQYLRGDMPFSGPDWDDLLAEAHASGNLYFGKETYESKESDRYQPVTLGPPKAVEAKWKVMPSGSAEPVLECENPNLIVVLTDPPRYLDPDSGTLGLLESSLPAAILSAWSKGPAVSGKDLAMISDRFSAITATQLPVPMKVETENRPASPPLPHLRVYSRAIGPKWDRFQYIVGQISFRYEDSRLLAPLGKGFPQSHAEIRDGRRVVWPRIYLEEQAQIVRLKKLGLMHLSEIFAPNVLDAAAIHSVVPLELYPSQQIAWLEILESPGMLALRDSGWTIETDPKAGLTSHDASEFFPEIEADPDHGIDWFRFDITYEINGQRLSLIPIIAQAIRMDLPQIDDPNLPEFLILPCENPEDGFIRFPTKQLIEIVDQVRHLFHGSDGNGPIRMDRLAAAGVADTLAIDSSETTRALARLGQSLKNITSLPPAELPKSLSAELRPYQLEGYRWLQFLAAHGLHGILADDMGLGKTVQTLAHLAAEREKKPGLPSLVIAPTSVVPNWADEVAKFTPKLKVLVLQGQGRAESFKKIAKADLVITSYPLLARDFEQLFKQDWHVVVLDEAQYIKNPKAISAQNACRLKAAHRICLSGTPMENHLGELWSLMRFLMPGFLSDEKSFNSHLRRPIERERSTDAQLALNRRVSPLILRRTKDQVATDLPEKTEIIHGVELNHKQTDLYESVRAAMDKRVRDAIAAKGLAKSHIIVLDALLKLRQICCHPQLLKSPAAQKVTDSAKLDYLTGELLPTLLEEGRRILLFSTFTSMLAIIEKYLVAQKIPYLILTGQTQDRATLVKKFQAGEVPIFLISLKAGGTGLNLTAADTVIHYDPWWNPAAENQATDRAHRIGQTKPVFVHKLVCRGTIEDRILDLQKHKSGLVEALLSEETSKLKIDAETLSHLLAPLESGA
jgi:hypothetical protein